MPVPTDGNHDSKEYEELVLGYVKMNYHKFSSEIKTAVHAPEKLAQAWEVREGAVVLYEYFCFWYT
jgi:hypothetical protein